jgi:hypothetical protein
MMQRLADQHYYEMNPDGLAQGWVNKFLTYFRSCKL